ncbi:RNA methyltransferase, TrmH family [Lachnospiraceae bacterium TWA4]|nr:RNA methyltransferase, TrmH family [Lachnospiraceae bacterium TWA4]
MIITSANNPRLKELTLLQKKSKARRESGLFIEEGIRMFREIPRDCLKEVYVSESFSQKEEMKELTVEPIVVSDSVFNTLTDTISPQGILAVVKQKNYAVEDLLTASENPVFLMLENIQDPGNLGTMMRTAEAANVTGVFLSKGSVDMYNPKVVRATMGAIFRLPFVYVEDFISLIEQMEKRQIEIYAACLEGAVSYDVPTYKSPCGLIIGNEGNGISRQVLDVVKNHIKIPMEGQAESLNAAICAAVYMYEIYRQRRMK